MIPPLLFGYLYGAPCLDGDIEQLLFSLLPFITIMMLVYLDQALALHDFGDSLDVCYADDPLDDKRHIPVF